MKQSLNHPPSGRGLLWACVAGAMLLAAGAAEARDRNRDGGRNGGMSAQGETRFHDRRDRQPGASALTKAGPVIRPAPGRGGYIRPPRWRGPTDPVKVVTKPRPVTIPGVGTIVPQPPTGKPIVRPVPERTGPVTVVTRHRRR